MVKKTRKSLKPRKKKKQTSTLKSFIEKHWKEKEEIKQVEDITFEILKKHSKKKWYNTLKTTVWRLLLNQTLKPKEIF